MHASTILSLLLATGFATAAPRAVPCDLTENDIIVYGAGGHFEILNKTDYAALQSTHSVGFDITAPTPTNSSTSSGAYNQSTSAGTGTLSARCSTETIWNLNPATSFLNWDVLMSSVVHATSGDAVVSVTAGYSISNIISVGVSSTAGIIGEYLSATLSVDYTQSWESSYTAGYTFTVPNGKYGAVVSNAKTTRHTGSVAIGCVGFAEVSEFTADSYSSQSYGSLSWVEGTISLCTGDSYPMPACNGGNTLS